MKVSELLKEGDVIKGKFGKDDEPPKDEPKIKFVKNGELPAGAKAMSMLSVFGSKELAALDEAGIKITEKPDYWEDFEGDGFAVKKNIHEVKLKKAEKTIGGKFKVYSGKEIYGGDFKPKGPQASVKEMPKEQMFIVKFADGTQYLCDQTGAKSYIRFWQKITK